MLARSLLGVAGVQILGPEQQTMQAALEVRSAKAELLAENVANADTPGYVSRDLSFDDALNTALQDGQGDPGQSAQGEIVAQNERFDGNDVDVNQAMAKVSENALKYVATLKLYSDSTGRLKQATSST